MPYCICAVKPFAQLRQLAQFDAYPEASIHAKALRAATPQADGARIKIMFAADAIAAEDLLLELRQAGPAGDDSFAATQPRWSRRAVDPEPAFVVLNSSAQGRRSELTHPRPQASLME